MTKRHAPSRNANLHLLSRKLANPNLHLHVPIPGRISKRKRDNDEEENDRTDEVFPSAKKLKKKIMQGANLLVLFRLEEIVVMDEDDPFANAFE